MTLLMFLSFPLGKGLPISREPNPETQIRQSWLTREYRSGKDAEKTGHFEGGRDGAWALGFRGDGA